MKWIILHWTAGTYAPSDLDCRHYHRLIDGNGKIYEGKFPIEANIPPLKKGQYAAHAARHNSWAIGVTCCAMHGAVERPFDPGKYPLRQQQVDAMVDLCADLCRQYDIPVEGVKCHSEVSSSGKWDINWLPGDAKPDPKTGDRIRAMIAEKLAPPPQPWWAALIELLTNLFWRK